MPDFSKLRAEWEATQQRKKEKLKKSVTVPREFKFSRVAPTKPSTTISTTKVAVESKPRQNIRDDQKNAQPEFVPNAKSMKAILSGGEHDDQPQEGRRSLGVALKRDKAAPMSKLERRLTCHFAKKNDNSSHALGRNTERSSSTVNAPGADDIATRAGLAIKEATTPLRKKTQAVQPEENSGDHIWLEILAKKLATQKDETVEQENQMKHRLQSVKDEADNLTLDFSQVLSFKNEEMPKPKPINQIKKTSEVLFGVQNQEANTIPALKTLEVFDLDKLPDLSSLPPPPPPLSSGDILNDIFKILEPPSVLPATPEVLKNAPTPPAPLPRAIIKDSERTQEDILNELKQLEMLEYSLLSKQ